MTAVAIELQPAPPSTGTVPAASNTVSDTLDPDAVVIEADTDTLMVMCSCSSSSDAPY